MAEYLLRRLIQLAFVLVGVSVVVFFAMRVLPGDVAQLLLGDHATAEQLVRLRHQLGLDQPIYVQYLRFALEALHGDFGTSTRTNDDALHAVLIAFPVTLQLSIAALVIAVAVGVPAGVLAATRPYSWLDNLIMTASLFGVSMPIFWLGLMLILIFAAYLNWLPLGGVLPIGAELPRVTGMPVIDSLLAGRLDLFALALEHLILPACTLATIPLALITRITRSEMLAALGQDYVRTARAKGVAEWKVVFKHTLRNALIPVVTVIGLQLGLLLSGAVLTETIFALPGLGRLVVNSVLSRDYPVVQAAAILTSLLFVLVNLVVDVSYAYLDPRIRFPMISAEGAAALVASPRRHGAFRFLRRPTARIGALVVLAFLILTIAAPVIVPYGPLDQDFLQPLAPPSTAHLLGTDQYGRDLLSRVIYGSRTALMSILVADGIALVLGSALGLVAGFYAGKIDSLIMRLMDVLLAFPYLLLALIIVSALGPSLLNSMIAIGIVYTPQYARLIRGQVLAIKAQDFVQAAEALGAGRMRLMLRHILPNSFTPILVMATLQAGTVVVETAGLSFLGLGAQPPSPDWGATLADGQGYFLTAWWIATFPGLAILIVVLGFNLLGDALRDHFDPRRR